MKNVSIIILTYNKLEYTRHCIESIRTYTKEGTYEIIVVDNASTDETVNWLEEQPDIKVIQNDVNAGFPSGCNQGVAIAQSENDILLLNNDIIVTVNWLENLTICLNSSGDIGAVGAVSISNANLQGIELGYLPINDVQEYAKKNNQSASHRWEEKIKLIGFCLLIRREAWQKAGGLDESFSPGYYEDDDFSLRLLQLGYRLMLCHDCFIYHYLGTSFRADRQKFYELLSTNQQKFFRKWGFYTTEFDQFELKELDIIEADKDSNLNILEIGCRIGSFLKLLKYRYPNATITGIESEKVLARVAMIHSTIISQPKDSYCYKIKKHSMDVIYLNINIGQVKELIQILYALHYYLNESGRIVFRFANAASAKNIQILLSGKPVGECQNGAIVAGEKDISKILSVNGYECEKMIAVQQQDSQSTEEFIVSAKVIKEWKPSINTKKIAMIHCINNEEQYQDVLKNWKSLTIPYGFEVEYIPVRNPKSMCSAYNQAMHLTDAKYKFYLHQDTYVINRDFFLHIIDIFKNNANVGLVGVIGTKELPESANWWEGKELRGTAFSEHSGTLQLLDFQKPEGKYEPVQVVDGIMIATQYDLEWREDILSGFHYYDVTQCLEFQKHGYQVVVPRQMKPWISHRCGLKNNVDDFYVYEEFRKWMRDNYLKEV